MTVINEALNNVRRNDTQYVRSCLKHSLRSHQKIMSTLTNPGLQAKPYRNALVSANPAHTVPTGQLRVQCAPGALVVTNCLVPVSR
jgi:hypothetical protein